MKTVFGFDQVDKAFIYVERKIKESLRKMNREAARLLSKGDYEGMETLVQAGKSIHGFQTELAEVRTKWGDLSKQGKKPKRIGKEKILPSGLIINHFCEPWRN